MKTEKKNNWIRFRVTESEREKIKTNQLKSGMKSISSFILSRVLYKKYVEKKENEIVIHFFDSLKLLEKGIRKVGYNLNEVLKIFHSKKVQYIRQKEIDDLKNNISEIQEKIEHTNKTIEHIKNKI